MVPFNFSSAFKMLFLVGTEMPFSCIFHRLRNLLCYSSVNFLEVWICCTKPISNLLQKLATDFSGWSYIKCSTLYNTCIKLNLGTLLSGHLVRWICAICSLRGKVNPRSGSAIASHLKYDPLLQLMNDQESLTTSVCRAGFASRVSPQG